MQFIQLKISIIGRDIFIRTCKYSVHSAQCATQCLWDVTRSSRTDFGFWRLCSFRRSTARCGCPPGGDMLHGLSKQHTKVCENACRLFRRTFTLWGVRTSKRQRPIVKSQNSSDGNSVTEQSALWGTWVEAQEIYSILHKNIMYYFQKLNCMNCMQNYHIKVVSQVSITIVYCKGEHNDFSCTILLW